MADSNNNQVNKNNLNESKTPLTITGNSEILTKFSSKIFETYKRLAYERDIYTYDINARPVSGVGENSYGFILQVCLKSNNSEKEDECKQFTTILKISPKNPAFRTHSRIVDLYKREVFMYEKVFGEFKLLEKQKLFELQQQKHEITNSSAYKFDIIPQIFYANLDLEDEFIIFEDLTLSDYQQNSRTNMPSYDLVCATFRSIAKMHAMSFVLQYRKPDVFQNLINEMSDNLFTEDMEPLTVEFGKKYIRRTRVMLEQEMKSSSRKQIEALKRLEENFKEICLRCVDGKATAPYAVICHGDFWNNNILYKYDAHHQATSAKLIDFQLSRYASPILDLVHYLYACTERDLRNKHFMEFMDIYHQTLTDHIHYYGHNIEDIYPKSIFLQHLKDFGIYGFCMAAFSIPFFISKSSELPDLDEVASAIIEISSTENSDEEIDLTQEQTHHINHDEATHKRLELLEEYDLLSERTLPIFKRRMCGIVKDLEKYEMLESI
ncbi:uncharacterized protein ACRADG_001753 [Cochliomyia hominivorax]